MAILADFLKRKIDELPLEPQYRTSIQLGESYHLSRETVECSLCGSPVDMYIDSPSIEEMVTTKSEDHQVFRISNCPVCWYNEVEEMYPVM